MSGWRWDRLGLLVVGAIGGLWAAWACLADDTPRWLTGMAGVFLLIGIGCASALAITAWFVIADDVRPRFHARKPGLPLALTTELGAFVGTRRFNQHPVRFWLGLSCNHRLFVGVMLFRKAEEVTFATEATHDRG